MKIFFFIILLLPHMWRARTWAYFLNTKQYMIRIVLMELEPFGRLQRKHLWCISES